MPFHYRPKKTPTQLQAEKIAELEERVTNLSNRVIELEKQCFGASLEGLKDDEIKLCIAYTSKPILIKKVNLLIQHFGLQFETVPEKTIIKESPTSNVQQTESSIQ